MGLKTFVKISKITNLSDARYCAGMGVDILGFNLVAGTDGYVDPVTFKEISEWVAGVEFAGEFSTAGPDHIRLATQEYPLDFIEVSTIDFLHELHLLKIPLILKIHLHTAEVLSTLEKQLVYASDFCQFITLHYSDPAFDEEVFRVVRDSGFSHFLRCGGLNAETASAFPTGIPFYGIDLEASPEERPGFKDYGEVMDILEILEENQDQN